MKRILNGIISENPTFVLLLGLCPALAVTTKFENAYLMGLCVMIVLLFTNIVVSLIKKFVNENVKIPVFILIIGTFVTTLEILLEKYIPNLYEALGVYLPLIVVNCIVLGRAIQVASKESVKNSILDAIGVGLGFTIAISLIALIREVFGANTITLMDNISSITGYKAIYTNILPKGNILPMSILVSPAGSFLVLGMLIALFNKIGGKKNDTN